MKLHGTIETFPLRELIEMVIYSSVTGMLVILGPGKAGELFFRDGLLYHVKRGEGTGIDALAELFEFHQARFEFISGITSEQETLWGSLTGHLQYAERQAMRWRQIRAYVPDLKLIPTLLHPYEATLPQVGPAHYPVLNEIDGKKNLAEIAEDLGWARIDVAEALVQMNIDRLVDLCKPARVARTKRDEESVTSAKSGLFDRMLARATATHQPDVVPTNPIMREPQNQEEFILKVLRT